MHDSGQRHALRDPAVLGITMKRLALSLLILLSTSLSACAQSSPAPATGATPAPAATQTPAEPSVVAGSPEARVRDALHALDARIPIETIGPAPIPGFRQVVAAGQVFYVSDDGKYLFRGGLLDLTRRVDLGEAAMAKVRKSILATLPESDRIVFAPSGPTRFTVVVLTDVECGFCRKFHSDIAKYNDLGIRVEYIAYPRAGLGSDDYRKMVAVWCAPNRQSALTDAKNGRPVAMGQCARTPVDMQYRAGQRMGLEGTPMILDPDGRMVSSYLPPEQLLQRLQAMHGGTSAG